MIPSDEGPNVGAYGLRAVGFRDPALLVDVPPAWTPIEIRRVAADGADDAPVDIADETATMGLPGIGEVRLQRNPATVVVRSSSSVTTDILVHPVLSWAAWVMACWSGRFVCHAAAFVGDGGAWVALGDRGDGKSTLMAALAQRGVPVLCDDVTVIDNGRVLAGPRRIDLRPDAPEGLGVGETNSIRGENRRALPLGSVDFSVPLAGFLRLRWGQEVSLAPVPPFDRIGALDGLVGSLRSTPPSLLDAVSTPMIGLVRPQSWSDIDASVEAIVSAVIS